jgi:hypothetical protein
MPPSPPELVPPVELPPPVEPLPPPVNREKCENWVRAFSRDRFADGIEKCLVTARHLGGHASGKGHQQDASRISAVDHEMRGVGS